jgi:hypothetical protein
MNCTVRVLIGLTLLGAFLSLLYWTPETMQVIEFAGVGGAIRSTHLIRIFIDLLTIFTLLYIARYPETVMSERGLHME